MKNIFFAIAVIGSAVVTALGSGGGLTSPVERHEYALVDDFGSQLVSHADFERERSSCRRIVTKRFVLVHLTQLQCEQ